MERYKRVEKPALDYLQSLEYSYIDGRKLTQKINESYFLIEVILPTRMKASLHKLNSDIS